MILLLLGSLIVVSLAVRWTLRWEQRRKGDVEAPVEQATQWRPRARTDSLGHHSSIQRFFQRSSRSGELLSQEDEDVLQISTNAQHDVFGEDEVQSGVASLSVNERLPTKTMTRFGFQGPAVRTIKYKTMVPPPTWAETSRRLLQQDLKWKLHRYVSLNLNEISTITLGGVSTTGPDDFTISVHEVGVTPKYPVPGGALEIYVKESSRDEWKEHAFPSAAAAAQFQVDLLACQYLGKSIHNMYQALELVHRGSMAFTAPETVLHDRDCDPDNLPSTEPSGVAWDDLMRCLGSTFSSMRTRLDAVWWVHAHGDTLVPGRRLRRKRRKEAASTQSDKPDESTENTNSSHQPPFLAAEYSQKRLMLGIVDFFRLFVPLLPETAVPQTASSRTRMEQLLRWRKRVARASVLVQAYVRARAVVNRGWVLDRRPTPVGYLKRRLAFDDHFDNVRHDVTVKNEFYEASVSRDVICVVRSKESLKIHPFWRLGLHKEAPTTSNYQGYSLVGLHSFQWLPDDEDYPLQPDKDPVLAIPSLRALIEANPENDFFIHTFVIAGQEPAMIIAVFVRSLPKGVDETFDRVVRVQVASSRIVFCRATCHLIGMRLCTGRSVRKWRRSIAQTKTRMCSPTRY